VSNKNLNQLYWDTETTGRDTKFSSIVSIHMELVNDNFQTLSRYNSFCSMRPGVLPEVGAVLVTGLSPKTLKQKNKSHFQMIKEIHAYIKKSSSCIMSGWNNILYDSELLRSAFYQNLLPIYIEQLDGNMRHDLLSTARATSIFDPGKINYPLNEKGLPFFKLEDICKANNINPEGGFHSAEVDVQSTIAVGKLIAEKCPVVWESALANLTKHQISDVVKKEGMFSIFEAFYGKIHPKLVTWLCTHKEYGYELAWDMAQDPKIVIDLLDDYPSFKKEINATPKKIRTIRPSRSQIILHQEQAKKVSPYSSMSPETLKERVDLIKKYRAKLTANIDRINLEKVEERRDLDDQLVDSLYPEEQIYSGGFPSKKDEKLMSDFHSTEEWTNKVNFIGKFDDNRYNHFALRICWEESPTSLPKDLYNQINRELAARINSTNKEKFVTIDEAQFQVGEELGKADEAGDVDKLKLLQETDEYIQQVKNNFEAA
jgi:exodeoxyribonuclease-1